MKIAIFTSNQPRHLALIHRLAAIASEVIVVQECTTAFPGQVEDFYKKSETMQTYFGHVLASERKVFGAISFAPPNASSLSLGMGDLSKVPIDVLAPALAADLHIVFGSSWIRGPLLDALVERQAINLHMGLSPWYRGTACNFWAAHDGNFIMIGGTAHLLTKGLDSGPILFHAVPPTRHCSAFDLGMLAVDSTLKALAVAITDQRIFEYRANPSEQNKSDQIRYSRNREFTDQVAATYLSKPPMPDEIWEHLKYKQRRGLIRPEFWRP